jgi:ferredoxin/flavodoxin---NADP+ reductase
MADPRVGEALRRCAATADACRQRRDATEDNALRDMLTQLERARLRRLACLRASWDVPPSRAGASEGRVELTRLTEDLAVLSLPRPSGFTFAAGQSAKLTVGEVTRRYSLASPPSADRLEFFIELRPGGAMSAQLQRLGPDTPVRVSSAKGTLALDRYARKHLMIATVTGIAPFMSILRSQLPRSAQFTILHGASYQDEFGYAQELERAAAERPGQLRYVPTVSRPQEARNRGWAGLVGRVESHLPAALKALRARPSDTRVYACGHPEMVQVVERYCRGSGFSVLSEPY